MLGWVQNKNQQKEYLIGRRIFQDKSYMPKIIETTVKIFPTQAIRMKNHLEDLSISTLKKSTSTSSYWLFTLALVCPFFTNRSLITFFECVSLIVCAKLASFLQCIFLQTSSCPFSNSLAYLSRFQLLEYLKLWLSSYIEGIYERLSSGDLLRPYPVLSLLVLMVFGRFICSIEFKCLYFCRFMQMSVFIFTLAFIYFYFYLCRYWYWLIGQYIDDRKILQFCYNSIAD